MIRHILLAMVCAAGYWLPLWLEIPSQGVWFFVELASWSMAIITASMLLRAGWASVAVAALECSAILLNLVCLWQYLTIRGSIYAAYANVVDAILATEIIVLIVGAPWDGIRRMVRERWGSTNHRYPVYMRSRLDHQAGEAR